MKLENKRGYLGEKGITLIALVVTIVVLLILAGVSVNALFGNSGIIEKAKEAQNAMDKAKENDEKGINELTNWLDNQVNGTTGGGTTGGDDNPSTTPKVSTLVGTVVDKNTKAQDAYGNKITIPSGFKILVDSTTGYTKNNIDVTKGIVVEDENGNQFVWIPVGKIYTDIAKTEASAKTITLGRYSNFVKTNNSYTVEQDASICETEVKINGYYSEDTAANHNPAYKNLIAKDIEKFCTKVLESGGYYIGRYEARTATERNTSSATLTPVTLKANDYVYNWVRQPQASERCQSMYTNKPFESDLINSYAWDTAIVFIQEFENSTYSQTLGKAKDVKFSNKGLSILDATGLVDKQCNIYDMAGNCYEWSTETYSNSITHCIKRGGFCFKTYSCTSGRGQDHTSAKYEDYSFRPVLYM